MVETTEKKVSGFSRGFSIGLGIVAAIVLVNLVTIALVAIFAPERLPTRLQWVARSVATGTVGKMTGEAGNCPAGRTVNVPYKCPTSSTRMCICQ